MRRADDNPETLKKRLHAYHAQTAPLIGYYSAQNIVRKVDASVDQDTVFNSIKNACEDMKALRDAKQAARL